MDVLQTPVFYSFNPVIIFVLPWYLLYFVMIYHTLKNIRKYCYTFYEILYRLWKCIYDFYFLWWTNKRNVNESEFWSLLCINAFLVCLKINIIYLTAIAKVNACGSPLRNMSKRTFFYIHIKLKGLNEYE